MEACIFFVSVPQTIGGRLFGVATTTEAFVKWRTKAIQATTEYWGKVAVLTWEEFLAMGDGLRDVKGTQVVERLREALNFFAVAQSVEPYRFYDEAYARACVKKNELPGDLRG